ncbi:uncharacterized mitochondrial protein AtMg00810-like [Solanum dulcamara]|uniref:uncharacterized mitochondrial protein AtMg00810-like n=1 Tax=Solanum dulcamara TaxID=45834 RepID=UPI002486B0A1|nr:uncharacterized mitochondrial protein AtMg00810-like [Solanum dulcamara]
MNQRKYALELISECGLAGGKTNATPLEQNQKLTSIEYDNQFNITDDAELEDRRTYQRLIGRLLQPGLGLLMSSRKSGKINAFCDADWASCLLSKKSVIGFGIKFGDSLVSWKSKKQSTVSRSSAEAEYRSMATTVAELVWLQGLLQEIGAHVELPMDLHCDNKAAMQIASNPMYH